MKKNVLISLVLTLVMLLATISVSYAETVAGGECGAVGSSLTWSLDGNGTLTISGTGAMMEGEYNQEYDMYFFPWTEEYTPQIRSVVIGDGVTTISDGGAFWFCQNLESVTIGSGVKSIGEGAFALCTSLKSVTIPDSVENLGAAAFFSCESLASVTIGNKVETIFEGTFNNCDALTSVTIPDGVQSIHSRAFSDCDALTSVILGSGLKSIGDYAFSGCDVLESVTIPAAVESIDMYAFNWCPALTNVTIKSGAEKSIAKRAFADCHSLTSVILGSGVTSIGEDAFRYCDALESVVLPDTLKTIGMSAFHDCSALKNLIIPDSVTEIDLHAFDNCTSLASLTLGSGITELDSTFTGCSALTSVSIPNGVTTLHAFYGCTNLETVTIPNSVETIWQNAFGVCKKLSDVYYLGTEDEWNEMTIQSGNECLTEATIHYVPMAEPALKATAATPVSAYDELENAINAASPGGTIVLLSDIDYSQTNNKKALRSAKSAAANARTVDLKDLTLDLNGYTIKAEGGSVAFGGDGATIQNGTFDLVEKNSSGDYQDASYALIIDNSNLEHDVKGTVSVKNVVVDGGVNVCGATVSLDNVTARTTTTKNYTLCAENNAMLTINSGTYNDGQNNGKGIITTQNSGAVKVTGGLFMGSNNLVYDVEDNSVEISGGTFNINPTGYLAKGYEEAEDENGSWTVLKAASEGVGSAEFYVSLTPQDEVLINFYANNLKDAQGNDEANPSKFKVVYTFNGKTKETTLDKVTGNKIVVAKCAAKELSDVVNILVYYNDELIEEIDYSAEDYCNAKIGQNEEASLTNLCNALLDYGAYAQQRFAYHVDTPYQNNAVEETVIPNNPEMNTSLTSSEGLAKSVGVSLSLEDTTKLNVYFVPAKNLQYADLSATVNGEAAQLTQMKDGSIRVEVPGVSAKDLDKVYTIEISAPDRTPMTLQYSPLSYAFNKQNDPTEGNVCKALYLYYLAAQAYYTE